MIQVKKRDGREEPLDLNKFHKVVIEACQGLTGVSASQVEINSQLQFYDGIKTTDIQETLIKSAADLISEESPNYQYVAGRLICYHLYKQVHGGADLPTVKTFVEHMVKEGLYEPELLKWYSDDDWAELNEIVHHKRNDLFTYAAMEQFRGKYLIKNRVTGEIHETPQYAYLMIAATLFHNYKKDRLKWVKEFYDAISEFDISLPTPIMAGVRTPTKQFSSCVLIECDDSLDGINSSAASIVRYVSQKAGIGLNVGAIRAINSPIRGGEVVHTGVVPFLKYFQAATKSCSQGGVRGGAITCYYPIWHLEVEDLLVLKNNKGTEENRARQMDYGVQFNKLMYERLLEGGDITLFSPKDVPGLYDAFFADQEEFRKIYLKAERSHVRKKKVKAVDLFSAFMTERQTTGRIYLMNVDHANEHGSFLPTKAPIKQSNLCCEITLPTKPLKNILDAEGEIALCTLSAINWGNIKKPDDFERPCTLAVRALDALLDYQGYPVEAARNSTMNYRPLGVGIINFAYWLAKNGVSYSDPKAPALVDQFAEAWSYYLIKASADLAREVGPCLAVSDTKYRWGITPNQTYKRELDSIVPHEERFDWKGLRKQLQDTGIRNATLMAIMPAETSAQISNATNGVEPPRAHISVKQSKDGVLKQVVPEYRRLKNKYELLWDMKSPDGYLNLMAVLQKYVDQSISVNTSYNPKNYPDEKIPMSVMLKDMITFYRLGGKCLYYFNTFDGAGEIPDEPSSFILPENLPPEEDCDTCKI